MWTYFIVEKCNEACTRDYNPVCGSDGKTYGNLCMMEAKSCVHNLNLTVKHAGKCSKYSLKNSGFNIILNFAI